MFPRLRQQILGRLDLVVELTTLGEYGLDEGGGVMRLDPCAGAPADQAPRVRDRCAAGRPQLCAKASDRAVQARP